MAASNDNIDNNNNTRARSPRYNKPLRDQTQRQIRKMLVEDGMSYSDIRDTLRLPQRTFTRYISEIFSRDRQLLTEQETEEEIMNQIVICRERLLKQRDDLLKKYRKQHRR